MIIKKYFDPYTNGIVTLKSFDENAAANAKWTYEQMFNVTLTEVTDDIV